MSTQHTRLETLTIDGIGEVEFVRKKGVRRLSIRLRPFESLRLLAPWNAPRAEALRFLAEKAGWVRRQRRRLQAVEASRTRFAEGVPFRTRLHTLSIQRAPIEEPAAEWRPGSLIVRLPADLDVDSDPAQDFIRRAVEDTYRREARLVLPARLRSLAERHGFRFGRVQIRSQRSRWGSCSARNDISLNLHLLRLPDHLVDYVLLHELAHTVEKNHGPRFWRLLDAHTAGKARALDRELRAYSIRVL